jgi:hypothetical protein
MHGVENINSKTCLQKKYRTGKLCEIKILMRNKCKSSLELKSDMHEEVKIVLCCPLSLQPNQNLHQKDSLRPLNWKA